MNILRDLFKKLLLCGAIVGGFNPYLNAKASIDQAALNEVNEIHSKEVDFYAVDITAPQLDVNSISVSKSQAKPGNKVTLSFKATDDLSGIEQIQVDYKAPLSGRSETYWMTYNPLTERYEVEIEITDETESGTWKIDFIALWDKKQNLQVIHHLSSGFDNEADLSKGNFTVLSHLKPGWLKDGATWYYVKDNGTFVTGWEKVNGTWYYFNPSGAMQTGWLKEGSIWYYLKPSGAMATGWEKVNGTWYYFNPSGAMQTGWLKQGNTWYYLKSSGAMATGWEKVNGTWYYFNPSGKMQTGWLKEGNTWYYLKSSGAMAIGWEKVNGTWYYFYSSGKMATSGVIDGWKITPSGAAYKL